MSLETNDEQANLLEVARLLSEDPEAWTIEHIQLYDQLDKIVRKHRQSFVYAQFKQDKSDIKNNIINQGWFKKLDEPSQRRIKAFLGRLQIHTFNLSRQEDGLRMNLGIYLLGTAVSASSIPTSINLQYLNSNDKFIYYLFFQKIVENQETGVSPRSDEVSGAVETDKRAFIAHNHPALSRLKSSSTAPKAVPEIENIYKEFLPSEFAKISAGCLTKIMAEIICFYDETETVVKTPISSETTWSLHDSLAN